MSDERAAAAGRAESQPRFAALDAVLDRLRCPVCGGQLDRRAGQVGCPQRHTFDIARQGYLNLRTGSTRAGSADTAAMVGARQAFLAAGHYQPIVDGLNRALLGRGVAHQAVAHQASDSGLVVDLAGGTGYYLAALLDVLPDRHGVLLDVSVPALARAARAHPRAAAIGADVWQPLPLATGCAAVVLNIFGPRNHSEMQRLLAPTGVLVTVTPRPDHLTELIGPLGLLAVDERKAERLGATLRDFTLIEEHNIGFELTLPRTELIALAAMGPSGHHNAIELLHRRAEALPDPTTVTGSVRLACYRPTTAGEQPVTIG